MKPFVSQLQAERLFPADPGAHSLCRLSVTQVLGKLHHAHQRLQQVAAGLAQDVGSDRRQLDVRPFQDLLQAVHLVGTRLDERRALAGELALGAVGDETGAQ